MADRDKQLDRLRKLLRMAAIPGNLHEQETAAAAANDLMTRLQVRYVLPARTTVTVVDPAVLMGNGKRSTFPLGQQILFTEGQRVQHNSLQLGQLCFVLEGNWVFVAAEHARLA